MRNIIVTGGGTGIGRAIATRFAANGDHVVITGRRESVLRETAATISGTVTTIRCDGTDPDSVEQAVAQMPATIDVLVNNAGASHQPDPAVPHLWGTRGQFTANYEANLLSAVLMSEALTNRLAEGTAALVHIGSLGTERGGAYGAAKAALASWNIGTARQLGPRGITSNVLSPGYVPDTEMYVASPAATAMHDTLVEDTMLKRPGAVDEIAGVAAFLASPDARYLTGQVIHVNGGAGTTR